MLPLLLANVDAIEEFHWGLAARNGLRPWIFPVLEAKVNKFDWEARALKSDPQPWMLPVMLKANPDKLNWKKLSSSAAEWMLPLLEANTDKLDWKKFPLLSVKVYYPKEMSSLKCHPQLWMLPLRKTNANKLDWNTLSLLSEEWMLPLLEADVNRINWTICEKKYCESWMLPLMLKASPDKLNWKLICAEAKEWMLPLLKANCEKLNWGDEHLLSVLLGHKVDWIKKCEPESEMEPESETKPKRKRAKSL
ncbi:hypothetical protein PI124_g18323 [Phytophthora idaei]|nr:hypothetical protein PI125_g10447 [Phytophthora idaei]KAG3236674.1 hypothetical protein PI124_g18323 [Phytophthora idaei]